MSSKGKIYLALIILGVVGFFYLVMASSRGLFPFEEVIIFPTPTPLSEDTGNWQVYRNEGEGFALQYPVGILVFSNLVGSQVVFKHSIEHQYLDPCDFRDGAHVLNELVDFNATYEIFKTNLKKAVETKLSYLAPDILIGDSIRPELAYSLGNLNGFKHEMGAEGCGLETYLFPLSENATLVVERKITPERTPLITNYQKYLALPGIITVEKEEQLFKKILNTFKYKEEGEVCIQIITKARNKQTGETKDFSTPCDVPLSWEKI